MSKAKKETNLDGFKIPLREVDSSGCMVYVGGVIEGDAGTGYPVHQGEKVWVLPPVDVREYLYLLRMGQQESPDAPTADTALHNLESIQQNRSNLCQSLSTRIVKWDWTDLEGKPLPQPYKNPEAFESLHMDELRWLITTAKGESPEERKND